MKIAFIGGVKFSRDLLENILKNGFEISILFSYEPSKRKFYSDMVDFDDLANRYQIKHVKVHNINDESNIRILQQIKPDLILVFGWSQLLKKPILDISRLGVIGTHPTELPKYRGRAPLSWSILKGLKKSALSFFFIEEGVDNGDIVAQQTFEISKNDDVSSLYEKMTSLGKIMSLELLHQLQTDTIKRIKQNPEQFVENWPERTPQDGKINWNLPAKLIYDLIRATTHPYPGAFTFFKNKKIIIWKAKYCDENKCEPGKIMKISNNEIKIGTKKGSIILDIVSIDDNFETKSSNVFLQSDEGLSLE